jgi:hypothetical protein
MEGVHRNEDRLPSGDPLVASNLFVQPAVPLFVKNPELTNTLPADS